MNRYEIYSKRLVWSGAFLLTALIAGCGGGDDGGGGGAGALPATATTLGGGGGATAWAAVSAVAGPSPATGTVGGERSAPVLASQLGKHPPGCSLRDSCLKA